MNLDFEQDQSSRTAKCFEKLRSNTRRSMKRMVIDRFYEEIVYFDSMGCVLSALKKILDILHFVEVKDKRWIIQPVENTFCESLRNQNS